MNDVILRARNSGAQVQPPGLADWEPSGTSLPDSASPAPRNSSAARVAGTVQSNDSGAARQAAARMGAMHAGAAAHRHDSSAASGDSADMDRSCSSAAAQGDSQATHQNKVSHRIAQSTEQAGDAELAAAVDMLAPMSENDGMFEIIMPNGQNVGVVVSATADEVAFLLNPSDNGLGERIRRHKKALERSLGVRIGKLVRLAVL